jgi:DNA-binding transcriptional regulator YiaG
LKKLRESLGIRQEEFARRLGISTQSVHRWERGHFKPSRLAMQAIQRLKEEVERGKK